MKSLMIIDGNSIVNRAFYGIRPLSTKDGIPTNAIYGFLNIMFKEITNRKPDYITVAFDVSRHTVRNEMYKDYKAQRSGMPDDLAKQMPYLKEVLSALNISYIEKKEYEADDIIGTVSKICEDNNIKCEILTGDRDDLQLCSDMTTVLLVTTKGGKTETVPYKTEEVMLKYEVTPSEFIDLKGLMGDSSDNIPGVKGVGEVTAKNLIKEFKSIENLYANIDSDKIKKSVKDKLINDREMAYLSKKLATIIRDVPIDFEIENYSMKEPKDNAGEIFTKLELSSFLNRLNIKENNKEETIDFLPLDKYYYTDKLYYYFSGDNFYADINGKYYEGKCEDIKDILKLYFENEEIEKYTFGAKEDIVNLNKMGIIYKNLQFDSKVAFYVADPTYSSYDLTAFIYNFTKENINNEKNCIKYFRQAVENVKDELEELELSNLFYDIEMPLISILANMEIGGIKIDVGALNILSVQYEEKLNELSDKIYNICGKEFNINSTKQLSTVLFEDLKLPAGKKTKTGYSTDNSVLEGLKGENEIIDYLLLYRMIAKLKSTYIDSMIELCDEESVLHSKFIQTGTQTGRLSSKDPNLQNIPVKTKEGRNLRKLFIPVKDGNVFVSADYSQVELRVLAQICGDENLMNAFKNNEDIHQNAASKIFNVPYDEVTDSMRRVAKMVNFGILYGKTEFTLSKDLNISRKEAKDIIDSYLNKYPGIRNYMNNIISYARENGYVKTLLGRIRYIKELSDRNFMTRKAGERIALNTPIQGTAADIMKIAMIKVNNRLKKENLDGRIVLQIHDELVIECSKNDCEKIKNILTECMENAIPINVPLTVAVGIGSNLYELK